MSHKDLAKEIVREVTSDKRENITRYGAPVYIGIDSGNKITESTLPFILENAPIAIVIIPYTYLVWTNTDTSQYVYFIDDKGTCSNYIEKNGWKMKFNNPYTAQYKTYSRYAIISNDRLELSLPTNSMVEGKDIERIWKIFSKIHKDTTKSELLVLSDLYKEMGGYPSSYLPRVAEI